MLRSIATCTLSGSLTEKIRAVADAGYDGIEIFENDILYSPLSIAQIRELVMQSGLDIVALQPLRDFEALPGIKREHAFDRAVRKLDVAAELGTLRLLLCSSVHADAVDDPARAAADLAELAELAAERGLEIGYEALAWGRHVRDVRQAWDIVERADHPSLGIVLDSFHLFARGNSLQCLDPIPVEKIALVQVADAPGIPMDVLQLSRHYRCFPGQGDFPVEDFLARLNAKNYSGYVSHEIFSDEFRAAAPGLVATDGYRSLSWLKSAAEGEKFKASHEARSVEFIEIATDASHRPFIVSMLKNLGFVHSHRHKSKSVALYQQGEINLIINAEPESFANNYFQHHGVSVCAIGLGVNDPQALVERLRKRKYTIVNAANVPDEMAIPAVLAIGKSLLYLCPVGQGRQRFVDIDFEEISDCASTDGLLRRVDHIGQAVDHTEFLSSLLFYRDALGFEPESQFDLHDPSGMMLSRTVSSQDKSVRIPINTSQSEQSSSGRFRERYHGSGTQQLAFSCDDIFAFAQTLDPDRVLPIPDNYYDDIDARFQIDAQQLAEMRRQNILFDEDQNGTFYHVYLREINGLFVEVVQRDGYQRFGEVNAATRLAAQAREDVRVVYPMIKEVGVDPVQREVSQQTQLVATLSEQVQVCGFSVAATEFFKESDIAAHWSFLRLDSDGVQAALNVLKHSSNSRGYLVEGELQKEAFRCLDVVLHAAQCCESVNVVRRNESGELVGERLDGEAIVSCLKSQVSFDFEGSSVSVRGCDSTAEAVCHALLNAGVAQLHLIDHSPIETGLLGEKLRGKYSTAVVTDSQGIPANSQLVLNCSVLNPPATDSLKSLSLSTTVCDLADSEASNAFLKQAELAGFETLNSNFIQQALLSSYLVFFGVSQLAVEQSDDLND